MAVQRLCLGISKLRQLRTDTLKIGPMLVDRRDTALQPGDQIRLLTLELQDPHSLHIEWNWLHRHLSWTERSYRAGAPRTHDPADL